MGTEPVETFLRHPLALPLAHRCTRGLTEMTPEDWREVARREHELGGPWEHEPLPALIDHVIATYHRPMPAAFARVDASFATLGEATRAIRDLLAVLQEDLAAHAAQEESALFPRLREAGDGARVHASVRALLLEHADAIADLQALDAEHGRWVAGRGLDDRDALATANLIALERWLCEHLHLESNVLFRRACVPA